MALENNRACTHRPHTAQKNPFEISENKRQRIVAPLGVDIVVFVSLTDKETYLFEVKI
jgi:hypothetical protein